MWDFERFGDDIAIISDDGQRITYSDLSRGAADIKDNILVIDN